MENLIVMTSLVLIVFVGYLAGRTGFMDEAFDRRLSALIVNVTSPALIISSTLGDTLPDRHMILPLLLISTITYGVLAVAAYTLPRWLTRKPDDEGVVGFALMFGNVGFIGFPIVASIFGPEAVFYAAILNVPNNFFVFTVGTMLVAGKKASVGNHLHLFVSTPMLASYLSIIIVAFGIHGVPQAISTPLSMIGSITVPGALMIIGSTMSQLSKRAMLGTPTVYVTSLLRVVGIPLFFYLLFSLMPFNPLVVQINTVIVAMPVATYGTMLCLAYGRDTTLITELTFTTTVLTLFTIPLLAQFFGG